MKSVSLDLYKKQKQIKKLYKLEYTPIAYYEFKDAINYLDKQANKKQAIYYLKRSGIYIITNNIDNEKMEMKGFSNLNNIK